MEKIYDFKLRIKVNYLCIIDDIYAYRIEKLIENKLINFIEGIATLEQLKEFERNPFENERLTVVNSKNIPLVLANREIEPLFLLKPLHELFTDNDISIKDYIITSPYTYLNENKYMPNIELYYILYSEPITTYSGRRIPHMFHIEYMTWNITNEVYELSDCLELLKNRTDVRFNPGDCKILSIPSYNVYELDDDTFRDSCLEFQWIPTEDIYNELLDKFGDIYSYDLKNYILNEILGFKDYLIE